LRSSLFITAAVAAVLPTLASAEMRPTPVGELVVTANRAPVRSDRVGQQVTVVGADEIRALQTPVLSDVLARTPGVSFSRNGGVGGATQVYIRGAEAGQTLLLVDGVRLNDPTTVDTGFDFGNLLMADTGRIEILRGPQSVLWGSQAIGGVVNLITEDPAAPFEADVTAEGGSHDWAYGRARLGGRSDRVSWRATAAYLTTDGVSAAARGTERDGYRNAGASGKARVSLTDQLSLDLRAVYSRGRTKFDGFAPPFFSFGDTREYGITETLSGYAGGNLDLLEGRLHNRLALSATHVVRKNWDPDQAPFHVTFSGFGHSERYEYQGVFEVREGAALVFGAEREDSHMRSASTFSPVPLRLRARTDSLYAQAHGEVAPGVTLAAGVRHDDHDAFGGHTVGQASVAWTLNDGATILRASWGQGFKAPSLYQLGSEYGNLGLKPEEATGWDAGVEQRLADGRIVLQAAWFARRTKNQIDFVSCFAGPAPLCATHLSGGYYDNVARTRAHGVELAAQADLTEALTLSANYTWTDARNRSAGPNLDHRLARRPAHEANAEAAYVWPVKLTTALAAHYVGGRFDDAANSNRLKSYLLWDLRASYPLTDKVELYGRIENLTDRRYQTIADYGHLGRAAYGGVRARF
jgi:vitamin B12 transporter